MDEDLRTLEREAELYGGSSLAKLATARLRAGRGLLWLWVAVHGDYRIILGDGYMEGDLFQLRAPVSMPVPPPDTVEVTVEGWVMGGDARPGGPRAEPPPPRVRRAWVTACLDIEKAVFGKRPSGGVDVNGPHLVDLATKKVVTIATRDGVLVGY